MIRTRVIKTGIAFKVFILKILSSAGIKTPCQPRILPFGATRELLYHTNDTDM